MARTKQTARRSLFSQDHICGCYFLSPTRVRTYLPQVSLKSHSSINALCFSTRLIQVFNNPNIDNLAQVRYAFPLYDGVTVKGYTISYGDKVLKGVVKQKDAAKQTYVTAVARGETAALLETLPAGIFGVTLGNVPPKTDITVEIEYCGELKHDAAVDGLRYNLPTKIAPRYGEYLGPTLQSNAVAEGGISITVDVDTADAPIRRVQSPSHPIAVSMGETSVSVKDGSGSVPYVPSQASATLTLGTAELDGDFILQVVVDKLGEPRAMIESHPTLPNQRAIMATLVPKFTMNAENPEIVFVADQSGSMSGSKNEALKAALKVFLKSLPLGVRFNICGFGDFYRFLWPKSQAYNETNVDTAMAFVDTFMAGYGGTEMLQPMTAAFENRLGDLPLQVMLLTDGEIWGENTLFTFVNEQIRAKQVDARVFAIGIGSDVSHTLVEGVARAGNGFAQFVTAGRAGVNETYEDLDQKIIRMLKAALYPSTKDYQLEVHYDNKETMADEEDFELVEKVSDCLSLTDDASTIAEATAGQTSEAKSFFDSSANFDEPIKSGGVTADRYAHLPAIVSPKILQAPTTIPPVFPFTRSNVYLLLGPESPQHVVSAVTLTAHSADGPLKLTIPVHDIGKGCTVHQMAARKATQELEEGRGWLQAATVGTDSTPAKTKYGSRFDELVEREAVRLGERYQVAGKWTSFVAVKQPRPADPTQEGASAAAAELVPEPPRLQQMATPASPAKKKRAGGGGLFGNASNLSGATVDARFTPSGGLFGHATQSHGSSGGLFGPSATYPSTRSAARGTGRSAFLREADEPEDDEIQDGEVEGDEAEGDDMGFMLTDEASFAPGRPSTGSMAPRRQLASKAARKSAPSSGSVFGAHAVPRPFMGTPDTVSTGMAPSTIGGATPPAPASLFAAARPAGDQAIAPKHAATMRQLIGMQTFTGAWVWNAQLRKLLDVEASAVDQAKFGGDESVIATLFAIGWLEDVARESSGTWEMIVDKAKDWLRSYSGMNDAKMKELLSIANSCRQDSS